MDGCQCSKWKIFPSTGNISIKYAKHVSLSNMVLQINNSCSSQCSSPNIGTVSKQSIIDMAGATLAMGFPISALTGCLEKVMHPLHLLCNPFLAKGISNLLRTRQQTSFASLKVRMRPLPMNWSTHPLKMCLIDYLRRSPTGNILLVLCIRFWWLLEWSFLQIWSTMIFTCPFRTDFWWRCRDFIASPL